MREIKFRAWTGDSLIYSDNHEFYLLPRGKVEVPSSTGHEFYTKEYPIMQFTGVKDKNSKDIYEGDIVVDYYGRTCIVQFGNYMAGGTDYYSQDAYGFYIQRLEKGKIVNEDDTEKLDKFCTVIGNIYENKDLLK